MASPEWMTGYIGASNLESREPISVAPPASQDACVQYSFSNPHETAIDVPAACIDGMCKILLFQDSTLGAFGPGLLWPVYYMQDQTDGSRIGGSSWSLGGVGNNAGSWKNGDSVKVDIFYGAYSDNEYIAIYDDDDLEQSADKWTIIIKPDEQLSGVSLSICSMTYKRSSYSSDGVHELTVPDFCIDGMCGIIVETDGTAGAFGPGLSMPVHYWHSSADNNWIGGLSANISSLGFSEGEGINGDSNSSWILLSNYGDTDSGYVSLMDDSGLENEKEKWTVGFFPGSKLTKATYYIFPLACDKY